MKIQTFRQCEVEWKLLNCGHQINLYHVIYQKLMLISCTIYTVSHAIWYWSQHQTWLNYGIYYSLMSLWVPQMSLCLCVTWMCLCICQDRRCSSSGRWYGCQSEGSWSSCPSDSRQHFQTTTTWQWAVCFGRWSHLVVIFWLCFRLASLNLVADVTLPEFAGKRLPKKTFFFFKRIKLFFTFFLAKNCVLCTSKFGV